MKPYDALPHFYDPQPIIPPRVNERRDTLVMLAALVVTAWFAVIGFVWVVYEGLRVLGWVS